MKKLHGKRYHKRLTGYKSRWGVTPLPFLAPYIYLLISVQSTLLFFMYRRPILCTLYGAVDFFYVPETHIMYFIRRS